MTKDEMKNRISLALKDPILQQGFEIICKENSELKKELEEKGQLLDLTEREWAKDTSKMIYYKTQLTKAKEIIKELLESCFGYNSKTVDYEIKAKAEQFLKENE